ncbi:hypothetical protein ACE1CI_38240 [Aerosakkonemataceae cyanobacterium BLCC-F50]|uniref:Uncharacterized protein n=1 Tax=Floridaenema flaviceps BLCC-F50 TaxID=3153642 RepID=A0ABV4Y4Z8_9CYAN
MKPDFQAMSRKELRAYILENRDEDEAFYAYMDKIQTEGTWVEFPAPKSIDDLKHFPELLEKHRQRKQEQE